MAPIKFIASQAHTINQYKNIGTKAIECCTNIYFNRQCLTERLFQYKDPTYFLPATQATEKKTHTLRIKDEIKFLYKKKQRLNNDLYKTI